MLTEEYRKMAEYVTYYVNIFARAFPHLRDDLHSEGMLGVVEALKKKDNQKKGLKKYVKYYIRGNMIAFIRKTEASRDVYQKGLPRVKNNKNIHLATDTRDCFAEVEAEDSRKKLISAVESLPERQRYIVQQHFLQGVSLEKIAIELGVSVSRVGQMKDTAMVRLKKILGDDYDI